jgi:hypothetical protein
MLRRVDVVRTDVSALSSSETSVLTRATRCNIPETPFFIGGVAFYAVLVVSKETRRFSAEGTLYTSEIENSAKKSKAIPVTGRGGL